MPGPEVHTYVDRLLFGRSYWRIHREMDRPYKYLGKYHRILFHDPLLAYVIARKQYPNDPNAIAAAQCHIVLDNMCSRNRGLKKALERLAKLDRKKRRGTKTTSGAPHVNVTDTLSDSIGHLIDLPNRPTAPPVDSALVELGKILRKLRSTHKGKAQH
jgi:hypothetical protein